VSAIAPNYQFTVTLVQMDINGKWRMTNGDHGDRVVAAHRFKFAAALQTAHKGTVSVLIRIETKAGHEAR